MSTSPATLTRFGACLCKAIKFTLTGPPIQTVVCHCINCQKTSGSAFKTNVLYRLDQFKITSPAKPKVYVDRDTDSGNTLHRSFCGDCGSDLTISNATEPRMKDKIVIAAGAIDGSYKDYVPKRELFGKRRHAWLGGEVVGKEQGKANL